jgi:CBS domain-containing protein
MKIADILQSKGHDVVTIGPERSVADAIRLLVEHRIGAVVVVQRGEIQGILSERDILNLADADPGRLKLLRVGEVMTHDLVVGLADDEIDYVMQILTQNRIRHLPIVDDGQLIGSVSIGDVVNALRSGLEAENRYLREYVQGVFS